MSLCERCGNYPNICGCAEAETLKARLAEAERLLREARKDLIVYRPNSKIVYEVEVFLRPTDEVKP